MKKAKDWERVEKENMPKPYELTRILYEDERTQIVWWTGNGWDGLKDIRKEKIVAWKKIDT